MTQVPAVHCDCCGLPIVPIGKWTGEDCPRCGYPVNSRKEELFLQKAIPDLQRVAEHGGTNLTVGALIERYQRRLNTLYRLRVEGAQPIVRPPEGAPAVPAPPAPSASMGTMSKPSSAVPPQRPVSPMPVARPAWQNNAPPIPQQSAPRRVFSLGSFLADQTINILASLGAFIILAGALSFVITTANVNLALSFLVLFGVQLVFGSVGIVGYRFPNFRVVAVIYTVIFALLVPLVGFDGYQLALRQVIPLAPSTLIAIAAVYAAIVYGVLAVYQRFPAFGYLGAAALAVADLALAQTLHLNYWWWPSMLMLLALPALISLPPSAGKPFSAVLREPVRLCMLLLVAVCALSAVGFALYSFNLDTLHTPLAELRFAILSMTLLLLLWTCLALWLTKRAKEIFVVPGLFLVCGLAFCYAFAFGAVGYALTLTAMALLYHGVSRFAARPLQPFGTLGRQLDTIALLLVGVVPLISFPRVPLELLASVYQGIFPFSLSIAANWEITAGLIAMSLGFLLTLSVVFRYGIVRETAANAGQRNDWSWLLLLSGAVFTWEYSVVVLLLKEPPVWYFLGLTLVLMVGAVLVRRLVGAAWANVLDVLVLSEALITLSLFGATDILSLLLLLFATLSYGVLLYQRRQVWLFLPVLFALLALPLLFLGHIQGILLIGLLLPLVSVAVRRLTYGRLPALSAVSIGQKRIVTWEWPLLIVGLVYGIVLAGNDVAFASSTLENLFHGLRIGFSLPVALELATFSLVWYMSAALAEVDIWLLPAVGFAFGAVLLPSNDFWVLVRLAVIIALLGFGVSRFISKVYALPLYAVALLSAVMAGVAGITQSQLSAAAYVLLGFAILTYIIGVLEEQIPVLWIAPFFAIWSVIDASQIGNLYYGPAMVLVCAALGVGIGRLNLFIPRFSGPEKRNMLLRYALPFYGTALASALLTGVYGTLGSVNHPFFGAIPDALLVYAGVAYGVLLFERRPNWLWLVAGFGVWGILLAGRTAYSATPYYVAGIGLGTAIVGLLAKRLVKLPISKMVVSTSGYDLLKFSWGWPWYVTALVGASMTGIWPALASPVFQPFAGFTEYMLLIFAALAYIVGSVEELFAVLWVAPLFATWSLIYSTQEHDFYRLLTVALVCTAIGAATLLFEHLWPALFGASSHQQSKRLTYAQPFYVIGLVAAVLTGVLGIYGINQPFYAAIPDALLVYAVVAYSVLLLEHQPRLLWIVAGFALVGTILAAQTTAYYVAGIGLGVALFGVLAGRLIKRFALRATSGTPTFEEEIAHFVWMWPWCLTSLVAAILIGLWPALLVPQPVPGFIAASLLAFTILALGLMLVERVPELLAVSVALAAWAIFRTPWDVWQQMMACSLLCVVIFVSQFVWKVIPPVTHLLQAAKLHATLALGGQTAVVLVIIGLGGLSIDIGMLFYVGAGALFVLALLLLWYGRLQPSAGVQRRCDYTAGLLMALVISWMVLAIRPLNIPLLALAPATYLTVLGPFLMRDERLPEHRTLGQIASVTGAALLLVPTLWQSFNDANLLLYTLLLSGEAFALLLLGLAMHVRIFVLIGAGLVIAGTLHMLFLPELGFGLPLSLTLVGVLLLAVATALSLVRHRIQTAWVRWE